MSETTTTPHRRPYVRTVRVSVRLSPAEAGALDELAARWGTTRTGALARLLRRTAGEPANVAAGDLPILD